jgi:hypothetical protein
MRSINVKIPLTIAQAMDERAQLNPHYLTYFINAYVGKDVPEQPIQELTYNYTFRVEDATHKALKLKSIDINLPMNEIVGRLLAAHY